MFDFNTLYQRYIDSLEEDMLPYEIGTFQADIGSLAEEIVMEGIELADYPADEPVTFGIFTPAETQYLLDNYR